MQTAYSQNPTDRRVGMLAYSKVGTPSMIRSKAAAVAIKVGKFVSMNGSDPEVCKLPTTSAGVTGTGFGFACWDPGRMPNILVPGNPTTYGPEYEIGSEVSIMEDGFIFVQCETNWVLGGAVFVRFTTGVPADGSDLGDVRNDVDSAKAVALPGARFDDSGTGPGIARVRLVMVTTPAASGAQGPTGGTGPTGPTGPTGA